MRFSLVILLGYFIVTDSAESVPNVRQSLGTYTVDRNGITVSGLSSGGAMAVQLHVAFSELFTGVGVFAGIPYYCAKGQFLQTTYCMATPGVVNVDSLIQATEDFANRGGIDPTINMQNDRVYVFHGTADRTVYPGIGEKVIDYYTNYVKPENFLTEMTKTSGHGFPTDGYGVACDTTKSPFINDCGYNGAYEMLNYLYGGNLVRPFGAPGSTTLAGTFYEFDQTQFISGVASSSDMDTIAYAYIPSACVDSGSVCKLHVSLHGCLQGRKWLDDEYAKMTGYNEVAELNNIIVIYPQATSNFLDSNPNGCWDWWGYLDSLFGTSEYTLKSGPQMAAIYKMITHMNIVDSAPSTPKTTTLGSGTGSPYNCPYANGFFPIPDYCGPDYLSCVDGIAYVQTCPVGSVFNPIKLYCDDPANVDCISLN